MPTELDHNRLMRLYNQGLNDKEIGKLLGVTNQPIMRWRKKHGLKSNYKSPGSPGSRRDKIHDLYNEGLTDKQIGNKLDLTRAEVRDYRHRMLKLPAIDNKSKELKRLLKAGHSVFEISQMYNVPKSVVVGWLWKYKIKILRSGRTTKKCLNPPPPEKVVGTKLCGDCGEEFEYAHAGAIRCPKCRTIKQHIYFASRDAWRTVGTWCDEAKEKLRKKIIEEDGEEMAHLVMNGMGK